MQILEKINREKTMISDYQQALLNSNGNNGTNNLVLPMGDNNLLKLEELYESEQLLIKENNLLEVLLYQYLFHISIFNLRNE